MVNNYTLKRASYTTSVVCRLNINPSLVLVQRRKTRPFITERLLMGRKDSNQTNKTTDNKQLTCCTTTFGTKDTETDIHFCTYNLRSKWN